MDPLLSIPNGTLNAGNNFNSINNINSNDGIRTQIFENGNTQGIQGNIMGVGGGVGNAAVDVTYSTKPNSQNISLGNGNYDLKTFEFGNGETYKTGNIMGVNEGISNNGSNSYSVNSYNKNINLNNGKAYGSIMENNQHIMGVGGGVGDAAVDVTYSTKPNEGNINLGIGTGTVTTTTTTKETTFGMGQNVGSVMGVGGGVGDAAVDVTYSTKPDNKGVVLGYGGISGLNTTTTTTTTSGVDELNINIEKYSKATVLEDQIQHIVQREIQPIVKTVVKPIIQKEIQPIVEREIQPIIQEEVHPVIEREIQPIIEREIQAVSKKEIQPIIEKEIQPITKTVIQPILKRE